MHHGPDRFFGAAHDELGRGEPPPTLLPLPPSARLPRAPPCAVTRRTPRLTVRAAYASLAANRAVRAAQPTGRRRRGTTCSSHDEAQLFTCSSHDEAQLFGRDFPLGGLVLPLHFPKGEREAPRVRRPRDAKGPSRRSASCASRWHVRAYASFLLCCTSLLRRR